MLVKQESLRSPLPTVACQVLREVFVRRKRLYLSSKHSSNFTFDTFSGFRDKGISPAANPVPIDSETLWDASLGGSSVYLYDLETGKLEKMLADHEIRVNEAAIPIGDGRRCGETASAKGTPERSEGWIYTPYVTLIRTKRDLSERQESKDTVDGMTGVFVDGIETNGKILAVYQNEKTEPMRNGLGYGLMGLTRYTYNAVLWETGSDSQDPSSMKILKTFYSLFDPSSSRSFWLRKLDDTYFLASNGDEMAIFSIKNEVRYPIVGPKGGYNTGDIAVVPRSSIKDLEHLTILIVIKKWEKFVVVAALISLKDLMWSKPRENLTSNPFNTNGFEITDMHGGGVREGVGFFLVKGGHLTLLDDNHVLVINSGGEYELWWFQIPTKQKKLLCKGSTGSSLSRVLEIPLSKEQENEDFLRMRNELESQKLPVPKDILGVIVKFV